MRLGVDLVAITAQLRDAGVGAFAQAYDSLIESLGVKVAGLG